MPRIPLSLARRARRRCPPARPPSSSPPTSSASGSRRRRSTPPPSPARSSSAGCVERTPEPQKNGKTINWCRVDVGAHNEPRDDGRRPRGIVCGAHNFEVGDRVVVALPGAVLPGPFPIAVRKTYGHVSDGMICSAARARAGRRPRRDHRARRGSGLDAAPGDRRERAARARRGGPRDQRDARTAATASRCAAWPASTATRPARRSRDPALPGDRTRPRGGGGFAVELADDAPDPRRARAATGSSRGSCAASTRPAPSPAWMQRRLTQAGMRPISLAVDVTNYVMLDLGQPLHAYDLAQARRRRSSCAAPGRASALTHARRRRARRSTPRTCSSPTARTGSAARASSAWPASWAAPTTEVGAATTDLLVEAAHFDPVTVARTARRHKLPSEAAKRFERGVDPQLAARRGRARGRRAARRARRRHAGRRGHRRRPHARAARRRARCRRPAARGSSASPYTADEVARDAARRSAATVDRREPAPDASRVRRRRPGGPTCGAGRPGRGGRPAARLRRDPVGAAGRARPAAG